MKIKSWSYSGSRTPKETQHEAKARAIARRAATEGIVLLENNGVLPLAKGSKAALYGGGAGYTIKGGTGSGAVNNRSNVSITEGLRSGGLILANEEWLADYDVRYSKAKEEWIRWIYDHSIPGDFDSLYRTHSANPLQMPEGSEIVKTDTDTAIYVISRVSGEGADRRAAAGDYYLSETEERELKAISELYKNVIVILNTGGVMDTSFVEKYQIAALVLLSQAGMEGGNALADILTGTVTPGGKLTDTWAQDYRDYPSSANFSHNNGNVIQEYYEDGIYVGYRYFDSFGVKPGYPFGYGLSYTEFDVTVKGVQAALGEIRVSVEVKNTGSCAGKQTVFLFSSLPWGKMKKEKKRLIGFEKTDLLQPNESSILTITADLHLLESYHAGMASYYLEAGNYYLFAGTSAEELLPAAVCTLQNTRKMAELKNICPLLDALKEISPEKDWEEEFSAAAGDGLPVLVLDDYVTEWEPKEEKEDEISRHSKEVLSQLTVEEKAKLCCGRPTGGVDEIIGNAAAKVPGAAGETTSILLEKYQVANLVMADGPAGIRVFRHYQVNPEDGSIYKLTPYQSLQNRLFAEEFNVPEGIDYYQFCSAVPIGTLLAQSFDRKVLEEVGELIGEEMEMLGLTLWLAPGMNIHRNPLCGRNFEYYSEDPLVSGITAASITKGVQKTPGIGVTIKHYACNNQEENRRGVDSIVSERALREIYLKGYEICIRQAQPKAIMTSYNKINGVHAANHYDLCTTAAREEWGFEGIIMTDWTTTNMAGGASAAKCLQAGNDLIMPGNQHDIQEIIDAVNREKDQYLKEEYLDACAYRILNTIFRSNRYER